MSSYLKVLKPGTTDQIQTLVDWANVGTIHVTPCGKEVFVTTKQNEKIHICHVTADQIHTILFDFMGYLERKSTQGHDCCLDRPVNPVMPPLPSTVAEFQKKMIDVASKIPGSTFHC